ncbi:MAG: serine acetyltransferase [Acidobacteriota bacterium]
MSKDLIKDSLATAVDNIVDTYGRFGVEQENIGSSPLPSRTAVISILDRFLEVLYPGYFGFQDLSAGNLKYHVGSVLDSLAEELADQVYMGWMHRCRKRCQPVDECRAFADQAVVSLLNRIPDIRRLLAKDIIAAYDGDPAASGFDEIIFCYPGLRAITIYRVAHELTLLGVPLLPRIMTEFAHSRTGIDIHPGARIGESFFIDHGTGVVIGETTDIGNHVKIYQGVTLGALSFPKDERGKVIRGVKRHPTIEDEVVIYAGATILGGDTVIGRGAVIGGNVWLTSSVPPYTKVTHEPSQQRIPRDTDAERAALAH